MIWIAIILLLAALGYKLIHDLKLYMSNRSVNHKLGWVTMVLMCSPSIVLFTLSSNFFWYLALPISAGMCSAFIWLWFDGIYNLYRGYGFWFTGSNDKDDAASDNILQSIPLWAQVILKTVPLISLVYIYIKSL